MQPEIETPEAPSERALLDEVRSHFTRDDDLPDGLLLRIDAALAAPPGPTIHEQEMVWQAWVPSLASWVEVDQAGAAAHRIDGAATRALHVVQREPGAHPAPAAPLAHVATALNELHAQLEGLKKQYGAVDSRDDHVTAWNEQIEATRLAIAKALLSISASSRSTPAATLPDADRYFPPEFEVWSGDALRASTKGPRESAYQQALERATAAAEGGRARIFEVVRCLTWDSTAAAGLQPSPGASAPSAQDVDHG